LHNWGMSEADAEKAMAWLVEQQFIDDRRFTKFYVRDKLKLNKWGRIKISYSLRQKKVDTKIIEDAIAQIDEEEYMEILVSLLQHKMKSVGELSDPKEKAKLLRFAAQRGFESELIYSTLSKLKTED